MKGILLLLLVLTASVAAGQDAAKQGAPENEQQVFRKVSRVGEDALRSFFMFEVCGHEYTIRADGRGERTFENARARNFQLKVDWGHIEQLYFLEHEGDLLLIYQLCDEKNVREYVVRIDQTSLKPVWLIRVSGIDFEAAVVEGGYVKLKAEKAVVTIDLRTGVAGEN